MEPITKGRTGMKLGSGYLIVCMWLLAVEAFGQGVLPPRGEDIPSGGSITGGPVSDPFALPDDEFVPVPPPDLEPLPPSLEIPAPSSSGIKRQDPPKIQPTPQIPPPLPAPSRDAPPVSQPPSPSSSNPSNPPIQNPPPPATPSVVAEIQTAGKPYSPAPSNKLDLQRGDRLRWKYAGDQDWRVLEAYGPTNVSLMEKHYEANGDFFHSFRQENKRIQIPVFGEAKDRRKDPTRVGNHRREFRMFVEVIKGAPKAPAPNGNCVVWQQGRLWLNDLVSGEIDTVMSKDQTEHLDFISRIPGIIFVLEPPSRVIVYALKVDFATEIFAELGRLKGRCDYEIDRLSKLMQVADTPNRQLWCEARISYEQERSAYYNEQKQMYDSFLQGQIDAFNLVRTGHPLPHVQVGAVRFRHENLDLEVGIYTDHMGKIILPANAFLWVNEAIPVAGAPFTLEIVDQSSPSIMGYDTRFRTEGDRLLAEEKMKGTEAWRARDVVIDLYTYASFRPPQPGGPPEYLVDVTKDLTGGLKRLKKDMIVSGRLGTIQLNPQQLKIELKPVLLVSPVPMDNLLREIMIGRFDLRGWILGRRSRIEHLFDYVPILPDRVLDTFEEAIDELAIRVYQIQKDKRTREPNFKFEPVNLSLSLARQSPSGEFKVDIVVENEKKDVAQVSRIVRPEIDLIDFAARSVAANRQIATLGLFRPMTQSEWLQTTRQIQQTR